jgi:hypothetical protein
MYKKQKGIVMGAENLQKHMLLKSKGLMHAWAARSTRGKKCKNEGITQNAYENK